MLESLIIILIYVIPILITLYTSAEILSRNPRKREHQLVAAATLCLAFVFGEELTRHYMPLSCSPKLVALWLGNAAVMLPCLSLHYIFRITGLSRKMPNWLYPYVLYIPVIPAVMTFFTGNIFNSTEFVQDGMWKVQVPSSQYYIAITVGNLLLLLYFWLMRRGMQKAVSADLKNALKVLMYGSLYNLLWNVVFGYLQFGGALPPYPYLWGSFIWCLSLRYTMLKYDFLSSPIKRFETLYMMNPAAILLLDEEGNVREANPAAQSFLQETRHSLADLAVQPDITVAAYKQHFQAGLRLQQLELAVWGPQEEERIVLLDSDFVFIEDERLCMVIARDVTEWKQAEEQVRFLAYHDPLTGLPNRHRFYEEVGQALQNPETEKAAIILLDLNDFKPVNDTYGHHAGDAFLIHVASLLRKCTASQGFAARLAGDEFVIFVKDADAACITAYTEALQQLLQNSPFFWDAMKIPVKASMGVGLYPQHGCDVEAVMQQADAAMYEKKREGKATISR
ncbi:GGDEF domain-containing protein [Ectobacillus ponti]|uniref:Sensor domain-containing diguanylate cyclase n=1 Tax=Ectobacillus ponti TaxID=2961894 RepID=A0AA42BP40_9BACI|nr:sensor domain-containing diguanylate cyclase [Ectobacillus ponti]MCP8968367.1 sensor domain-containing diguanylate cyclase [Ectobacillus ponti]